MGFKIIDKMNKFIEQNARAMDRAVNRMAVDVERSAKARVPVSPHGGHLRASGMHKKKGFMKYVVVFDKEYAGYQEFGQRKDGSHVVRHYSTPGTGKFYLRDSGRNVAKNAIQYFKQEARSFSI